jgi:hypothetical protein
VGGISGILTFVAKPLGKSQPIRPAHGRFKGGYRSKGTTKGGLGEWIPNGHIASIAQRYYVQGEIERWKVGEVGGRRWGPAHGRNPFAFHNPR